MFTSYVFTLNNYTDEQVAALKIEIPLIAKYAIFGREVAPTTGTPHLQGYIRLERRARFNAALKWWKDKIGGKMPHIERAKGSAKQNEVYAGKEDTEPWTHGVIANPGKRTDIADFLTEAKTLGTLELAKKHPIAFAKYHKAADKVRNAEVANQSKIDLQNEFKESELRLWQKNAVKILDAQKHRQLLWISDPIGNHGKTWLAKWLVVHRGAFYIRNGKAGDIAYAYQEEKYVVFDLTRAQKETVNYNTIESFLDGMLWSPKYESRMKIFKGCNLIVMANWLPNKDALSRDRWVTAELDGVAE